MSSPRCVDVDPTVFDAPDPWPAIIICQLCPRLFACRAWAYRTEVSGVVGGVTEAERQQWQQAWGVQPLPATMDLLPIPIRAPRPKPTPPPPRQLTPCGTPGAYDRHRNAGETPCDLCKADHAWRERRRVERRRQSVA